MSLGDGNELNANPHTIASSESVAPEGDPIILWEKIKSPYSLEAMEKSLDNLRKSNKYGHLAREYDITTTHHYVKYYPESEEHLDLLAYDNQLILYPYPLDREIVEGGDYFIDPDTPIDEPMPLYTTIEVDHQLPKEVPHEILIKLHNM